MLVKEFFCVDLLHFLLQIQINSFSNQSFPVEIVDDCFFFQIQVDHSSIGIDLYNLMLIYMTRKTDYIILIQEKKN